MDRSRRRGAVWDGRRSERRLRAWDGGSTHPRADGIPRYARRHLSGRNRRRPAWDSLGRDDPLNTLQAGLAWLGSLGRLWGNCAPRRPTHETCRTLAAAPPDDRGQLRCPWHLRRHPAWNRGRMDLYSLLAGVAQPAVDPAIPQSHTVALACTLALFAGGISAAVRLRRFALARPRAWPCAAKLAGGATMSFAATMIPGGNDMLLLSGLPSLNSNAWAAYVAMMATLSLVLLLRRGLGPRLPSAPRPPTIRQDIGHHD